MNRFRRAPWWIYAVTIGVLNIARQIVFPPSRVGASITIGLFLAVLGIAFAVVTLLWALVAPRDGE